jgi:ELWxxDGT repeat protein
MKTLSLIIKSHQKRYNILILILIFNFGATAQQFNQISQESPSSGTQFENFVQLNDNLIFTTKFSNTHSLCKSTGTSNGTSLVMNFNNFLTSVPYEKVLIKSGTNLFFKTTQGTGFTGKLWKTDGSNANTVLVKDMDTRNFCSNLCDMNGTIYFITKYSDQVSGNLIHELWKSDGTLSGTTPVKDWTNSGYGSSINIREFNNKIYFSGNESDGTFAGTIQTGVNLPKEENSSILNGFIYYSGTGGKLWKTNGTTSGTLQAVNFSASGNFYTSNGWIYFAGGLGGSSSTGVELCRTDGTLANTVVLKDIYTGFNSSYPNDFIYHNGNVFFTANDGIHGKELWKTDGTNVGTTLVKDIFTGSNGIAEFYKTIHDSQFYFTANRAEYGVYSGGGVWKSDGTELNTVLVQSFDSVGVILEVNCNLFLSAVDSISSVSTSGLNAQLWCDTSSNCVSADNNETTLSQFKLYPNPTSSEVKITINPNQLGKSFTLFDNIGREKMRGVFNSTEYILNLESFEPGIYLLKTTEEETQFKIVKN